MAGSSLTGGERPARRQRAGPRDAAGGELDEGGEARRTPAARAPRRPWRVVTASRGFVGIFFSV